MRSSLTRVLILTLACAAPAIAQGSTAAKAASPQAAGTAGQFESGPFYAGPRVWVGNLNGSVAIGGQIERGLTKRGAYGPGIIAGGAGIDYYSWDFDYPVGQYKYSVIPLQVFSNYHFVIESNKKIDPYAGLALVYSLVNASWKGSGLAAEADGNYFDLAGQAGVRYFLNEKVALQGQVGFGYGTLGLGATWKF
jgi:hypothetical protein